MGQVSTEESIQQLSAANEQDVHLVLSWQQTAATSNLQFQLEDNVKSNTEQLSSDPQAQDQVNLNMRPILLDSEAHDGPSVKGHGSLTILFNVGFEAGLSGSTIHPISRIVNLAFGQNQSETICRLRFLALFSLAFHAIIGVPYLFGDFYSIRATYLVMLMMTIGAIVVALISLLVSYWPISDPSSEGWSNCITRLLIANLILLGSRRAVYWTLT